MLYLSTIDVIFYQVKLLCSIMSKKPVNIWLLNIENLNIN